MPVLARHTVGGQSQKRRLGILGRISLVAAWAAFWLGTALFPCCQAIAAMLPSDAGTASHQPAENSPQADAGAAHDDCPGHSSDSPCGTSLTPVPVAVGESGIPEPDRATSGKIVAHAAITFDLASDLGSDNPKHARDTTPPPAGFHERTQRRLI